MQKVTQDLRYGMRQLSKSPAFAFTAILSLALGIGATVAMFSVVYGVLLHPFPYADVDRLCNFSVSDQQSETFDVRLRGTELKELRQLGTVESIATWNRENLAVTGGDIPEDVVAYSGIGETFPTLGVPALLGRNLGPSDSLDGQETQPVVVLHYRFWQRHFNGDQGIIGKALELDHKRYTIVGVTRPNFTWDWGADVYLPQEIGNPQGGGVVLKLRPGVSLAAADAELQSLWDRFARLYPRVYSAPYKADIRPLTWEITRNMGGTLYALFAAVTVLLVIGCGNVSILLLARGAARQHEFAVRSAVGAGGFRIVRQLLTESLLLAMTGTVMGIVLAYSLLSFIIAWLPAHLFPPDVAIRINLPVLVFSAGLVLLTTVLSGLFPALQMSKPEIRQIMQSGSKRATRNIRARRLHGTLVAAQTTLTLLLLTGAGATIGSFLHLLRVPLGYEPHNVVSVGIPLRQNSQADWQTRVRYFENLRMSIGSLPDVVSASIAGNATPPNSGWELLFDMMGRPTSSPDSQIAKINLVDSDYFRTLQMPLLEGRIWRPEEVANGVLLVIVNQTFVRRYSPNEDVLGHFVKIFNLQSRPPYSFAAPGVDGWMQIIGVVADSVNDGVDRPVQSAIFLPYSIQVGTGTRILVRTRISPESTLHSIRKQIAVVNPDQQTSGRITELEEWIRDEPIWARIRLTSTLLGGFSLLALTLSAVGLYSVVSYSVAQRTNEFGIRIALGAARSHVWRIAVASLGVYVGSGAVIGVVLTLMLNRLAVSWTSTYVSSPVTALSATFILALVSGFACSLPAWRASNIDPTVALRSE
ncbi:MAG TPA: ABC transporter permease [Candidatus Sulfotelmatobacter sp.]|nr:ABC transporter permease [Candidatus Sulfotelmatobacter sp.]